MKKQPVRPSMPPIVNGSAAVRIGGAAIKYLLSTAKRNGLSARCTAEDIILQHQHAEQGHEQLGQPAPSLGAQMLAEVKAGKDPVQAAVAVVTPAVRARLLKGKHALPVPPTVSEHKAELQKAAAGARAKSNHAEPCAIDRRAGKGVRK